MLHGPGRALGGAAEVTTAASSRLAADRAASERVLRTRPCMRWRRWADGTVIRLEPAGRPRRR